MARIFLVGTIATIWASIAVAQQVTPPPQVDRGDPTLAAYATVIKTVDLNIPIDRPMVIAYLDVLVSTAEGLALDKAAADEGLLSRMHEARRDLRRFARTPLNAAGREQQGHRIFSETAAVIRELDRKLGANRNAASALEALERAARSLDDDYPIRFQPDSVQNFLVLGGEALTKIVAPK